MKQQNRFAKALLVAACVPALAACGQTSEAAPTADGDAATVELSPDNPDLSKVTLTEQAAERLGITTVPVVQRQRDLGGGVRHPLWGGDVRPGRRTTWAYTETEPLTYVRDEIIVDRIVGSRAMLRDGPAVGTPVVNVGAAELYGAELGIDH
ncbi:MAG: hypothetical protein WKF82_06130 [Nocardioidaceae bacterium]